MNRREFLLSGSAAAVALAGCRLVGSRTPQMRLGCQMWGVKEFWEKNPAASFPKVFAELKKMGYEGVQSRAFWSVPEDDLAKMLSDNGLALADMPVDFVHIEGKAFGRAVDFCQRFGIDFIYIPWFDGRNPPEWRAFCTLLDAYNRKFAPYGIRVGYHNHIHEFTKPLEGEYPADILRESSPAMELDIGPVTESGRDAVEWIRAFDGRVPGLHAKPYPASAIGAAGDRQDWPAIVRAARQAGTRWLVVECEQHKDTYEDVRRSASCLRSLLASV